MARDRKSKRRGRRSEIPSIISESIDRHPKLSGAELSESFRQARAGNIEARNKIVQQFLPFAIKEARHRYRIGGRYQLDDLIQTATIGLMNAVARYEPKRGGFGNYARLYIQAEMTRFFGEGGATYVPDEVRRHLRRINNFLNSYFAKHNSGPTKAEIAEGVGLTEQQVEQYLREKTTTALFPIQLENISAGGGRPDSPPPEFSGEESGVLYEIKDVPGSPSVSPPNPAQVFAMKEVAQGIVEEIRVLRDAVRGLTSPKEEGAARLDREKSIFELRYGLSQLLSPFHRVSITRKTELAREHGLEASQVEAHLSGIWRRLRQSGYQLSGGREAAKDPDTWLVNRLLLYEELIETLASANTPMDVDATPSTPPIPP